MIKRVISVIISITAATSCSVSCRDIKEQGNYIQEEISSVVEEITIAPDITKPLKDAEKAIKQVTTTTKRIQIKDPYISKNLGTFSLTFYIPDSTWGYATATGECPRHLATCAVDPRVIPYGSIIEIVGNNGQTIILRANDCGGGINGNKIDIFWDTAIASVSDGYKWMGSFGTVHSVYLLEE